MKKTAAKLFRERIRQLREERGWTQERAAEQCGIGYKLFQLYELGIKRNPGLESLEKIAAGFGFEIHEFLAPILPKNPRTSRKKVSQSGK